MKDSGHCCGCLECRKIFSPLQAGASAVKEEAGAFPLLNSRAALLLPGGTLFVLAFLLRLFHPPVALSFIDLDEALFLLAFILAGSRTMWKALRGVRRGSLFNEHTLMSLAAAGAIAIGEYPEAAAIMVFFNLGELLEDSAVQRSRRSIAALMESKPDYANLVLSGGNTEKVAPEELKPNDEIIVRPGEKIALDGVVISGSSSVNNAALTGEAIPLGIDPGDTVLAGAVNGPGLLRIRVSRPFSESSLAQIYRLILGSAERKAPAERFITSFARYYTPAVIAGALLLALLPPLLIPGAAFSTWLYRALVLLVISCPCALVISIPLGYLCGIAGASRRGILVKGAGCLEALRKVKVAAFDKTGTITEGVFQVTQIIPAPGMAAPEVLEWAAHAEAYSSHPLGRSIRDAYSGDLRREEVASCQEMGGLGVKARVRGKTVLAGSLRLLRRQGVRNLPGVMTGEAVYVAVDGEYAGCLVMGDRLRRDAAPAVQGLKSLGVRRTVLLTGDHDAAAQEAARGAGFDFAYASLFPGDKVAHLEALQKEAASYGGRLAFVGDGINDAPALSRADIGIAMGGAGSDAAIEAADVVIMDDQLLKIAAAMRISIFTRRIVLQNIALALGVKALVLTAATLGAVSIWGALFADVGAALLAIANATRLLRPGKQEEALSAGNNYR